MQPDFETIRATVLLLGPLVLGLLQQLLTEPPARAWHSTLHKSPYRPPNAVFPLVWTWSYLTLGYASHLVVRTVSDLPLQLLTGLYVAHLVLLNSWGVAFFTLRRVDMALNVLLLLDLSASVLLASVATLAPFAAALCLPYFCWLLELTYLNIYMFRNNPDSREAGKTKETLRYAHERGYEEERGYEQERSYALQRRMRMDHVVPETIKAD